MGRSIMTPLSVVFGEVGSKSWDYRDWISGSSQEWAGEKRELSVTYLFRLPVVMSHAFAGFEQLQDLLDGRLLLLELLHL